MKPKRIIPPLPSALFVHASLPRFLFSRAPLPIQLRFRYLSRIRPLFDFVFRDQTLSFSLPRFPFEINAIEKLFEWMAEASLSKDRRVCDLYGMPTGSETQVSTRLDDISFRIYVFGKLERIISVDYSGTQKLAQSLY